MSFIHRCSIALGLALVAGAGLAQGTTPPDNPRFDAELAQRTGADERGMRPYVLVILKTGPKPMPAGPARDEMFKGHFANMKRLAAEGKLAMAGPLDGVDGWRGLYVFVTPDLEQARQWVATDPVVERGEMVPELHRFYGSASLVLVPELHERLGRKSM